MVFSVCDGNGSAGRAVQTFPSAGQRCSRASEQCRANLGLCAQCISFGRQGQSLEQPGTANFAPAPAVLTAFCYGLRNSEREAIWELKPRQALAESYQSSALPVGYRGLECAVGWVGAVCLWVLHSPSPSLAALIFCSSFCSSSSAARISWGFRYVMMRVALA